MTAAIQQIALVACATLLLWAALDDLVNYRIPNRVSAAIAALYPAYGLGGFLAGAPFDWSGAVLAAAAVFAVGFALFNFGLVGGGDVKLMTAVAVWAGLDGLMPLLLITGVAGGLLSLALIAAKTATLIREPAARPDGVPLMRAVLSQPAPYGVAIAAGGLFLLARDAGLLSAF